MQLLMLKSKIHRAVLTGTELDYEGSVAIDALLMNTASILPGKQARVLNLNNGARLVTYAIAAPAGSGTVSLRGAAARADQPGDVVILLCHALVGPEQAHRFFGNRGLAWPGQQAGEGRNEIWRKPNNQCSRQNFADKG